MKNQLTLGVREISRAGKAAARLRRKLGLPVLAPVKIDNRPQVRGDCAKVPRPCPYVGCRYNMFLDLTPGGGIIFNYRGSEPGDMHPDQSCALDIAADGPVTCKTVSGLLNLTTVRSNQIERQGLEHFAAAATEFGLDATCRNLPIEEYEGAPSAQEPTMTHQVTQTCPKCHNLQKMQVAHSISHCALCGGLGATIKPHFVGTEKGRMAKDALIKMRRMRLEMRNKQVAKIALLREQAGLDSL